MNFFSFNFPLREYFFCTSPALPPPISFLMARPLLERGDLRITICQLRIDDGIYNVARVQILIGCRIFIALKFDENILGCEAIEFSRTFRYSWTYSPVAWCKILARSIQSGQKHQTLHGCSLGHVSQY